MKYVPCRFCKERTIGCHGRCEKYLDYKAEREKVLEIKRRENAEIEIAIEAIRRRRPK
jgi:hypothetical protein